MTEVKTQPVTASFIADVGDFKQRKVPGSFNVEPPEADGEQSFWYCCPCGCGAIAPLTVGDGFKPADGPSWRWNGSTDKPELQPSVHHRGHWHGWLRNGEWVSC